MKPTCVGKKKAGEHRGTVQAQTSDKQYLSIAVEEFEKILVKQPNNTSVLNNIAYFLADNNEQLDKALEYAKRAHEDSPNDGNIMDTYAYTLCKVGDYAKAGEVLQMGGWAGDGKKFLVINNPKVDGPNNPSH